LGWLTLGWLTLGWLTLGSLTLGWPHPSLLALDRTVL